MFSAAFTAYSTLPLAMVNSHVLMKSALVAMSVAAAAWAVLRSP